MSLSLAIYNQAGTVISTQELDSHLFDESRINTSLVHEFVLMQLSNARMGNAHSKDRGEVNYSNRKLFKQKGTGNARPGSLKSPLRKQGGAVFGPKNTVNYTKTMTKKAKKLAILSSVLMKLSANQVVGLESFVQDTAKTKPAYKLLTMIAPSVKKHLIVLPHTDDVIYRSFRNIKGVKVITVDYVNPYDVLTHHTVVFVGNSLDTFAQSYT